MFSQPTETKRQWREILEYLYQAWINTGHPITVFDPSYCKGALRLSGIIARGRVEHIVH